MTGNLYGADIEALRQLADRIARGGETLSGVVGVVESAMPDPEQWSGADAESFREEEEISGAGHHIFSVYPASLLGERFEKFFDPTGTARMSGSPKSYSAEEFESAARSLPQLNEAVAVSIVSGVRRGSDMLLNSTVYAGPHGVHVLRGSERDDEGTPVTYTLQEVAPRGLRALAGEMIPA